MSPRVIVLKLGGSVLASAASLPRAVHEIYRWRRDGFQVVAVVSAFAGETERRLAQARELGAGPRSLAAGAATGELHAAALLCAALDRAGVPASLLAPAALGLLAEGDPLEATPVAVDRARLELALALDGVAVVPGFAGLDERGRTVLFGRGGSDLTALFLAHALAARCRLIKDVDGLFERDPALPGPRPRRYASATWEAALATDGTILQHRAVRFARERGLAFEVACLGGVEVTLVGEGPTQLAEHAAHARPLRVALLGLGTVGGGVWHLARELPESLEITAVACRDARRALEHGVPERILRSDPETAARADVDVVVECLGGLEPARSATLAALRAGRDVVTANKLVLARHGAELRALARAHGGRLLASAAVGGSAPILERIAACNGSLRGVRGVLNGTVNLVLERVAGGAEMGEALAEARRLGLTEADASRDLDGRDTADKLGVIAGLLGSAGIAIEREELDLRVAQRARTARERGARLRQVAELDVVDGQASARVRFAELALGDPLFDLPDASNAAVLTGRDGPLAQIRGTGAGRWPAAESVLGDLLELARSQRDGSSLVRSRGDVDPPGVVPLWRAGLSAIRTARSG